MSAVLNWTALRESRVVQGLAIANDDLAVHRQIEVRDEHADHQVFPWLVELVRLNRLIGLGRITQRRAGDRDKGRWVVGGVDDLATATGGQPGLLNAFVRTMSPTSVPSAKMPTW